MSLVLYFSISLSTYLFICLPTYLSIYLSVCLFVSLSQSFYPSICRLLSTYLSTYLPIYLPTYLPSYQYLLINLSTDLSIYRSTDRAFDLFTCLNLSAGYVYICLLYCARATRNESWHILFSGLTLAMVFELATAHTFSLLLIKVLNPLRLLRKTASGPQKVLPDHQSLTVLLCPKMCFARRYCVCFFKLSTSKSARQWCAFYHFDFDMCFAHSRVRFFNRSPAKSAPNRGFFSIFETCSFYLFQKKNMKGALQGAYVEPVLWTFQASASGTNI